jgi:hypothetical protein
MVTIHLLPPWLKTGIVMPIAQGASAAPVAGKELRLNIYILLPTRTP